MFSFRNFSTFYCFPFDLIIINIFLLFFVGNKYYAKWFERKLSKEESGCQKKRVVKAWYKASL